MNQNCIGTKRNIAFKQLMNDALMLHNSRYGGAAVESQNSNQILNKTPKNLHHELSMKNSTTATKSSDESVTGVLRLMEFV